MLLIILLIANMLSGFGQVLGAEKFHSGDARRSARSWGVNAASAYSVCIHGAITPTASALKVH